MKPINKLLGLYDIYESSSKFWKGKPLDLSFQTYPPRLIYIFLKNFLSIIDTQNNSIDLSRIKSWDIIYDGVDREFDNLIFEPENLKKILYLFKNGIFSFRYFMNAIKDRSQNCTLDDLTKTNAYKMLLDFLVSDEEYASYKEDYTKDLKIFFSNKW